MSTMMTNRHGNEIRIGQIWLDDPRRTVIRSLLGDDFTDAGTLGTAAMCTVVQARNTETGDITRPGWVLQHQRRQPPHHRRRQRLPARETAPTCTDYVPVTAALRPAFRGLGWSVRPSNGQ